MREQPGKRTAYKLEREGSEEGSVELTEQDAVLAPFKNTDKICRQESQKRLERDSEVILK